MNKFSSEFESLANAIRDSHAARAQAHAARMQWLTDFRNKARAARTETSLSSRKAAAESRQSRGILLSELLSHTHHLLGRFQIEMKESRSKSLRATHSSQRRRTAELARLMKSCRTRRREFLGDLGHAKEVWERPSTPSRSPAVAQEKTPRKGQKR